MSWHWRSTGATSSEDVSGTLDRTFATQGDAETWLGEVYPDLLAAGCRAVTLYEEDRVVYGPMSLDPEISSR